MDSSCISSVGLSNSNSSTDPYSSNSSDAAAAAAALALCNTTNSNAAATAAVPATSSLSSTSTLVYIPSKEYAWLPARIISTTIDTTTTKRHQKTVVVSVVVPQCSTDEQGLGLLYSNGTTNTTHTNSITSKIRTTLQQPQAQQQTLTLPVQDELPLQNVFSNNNQEQQQQPQLQIVTDLADLPFLHEVRIFSFSISYVFHFVLYKTDTLFIATAVVFFFSVTSIESSLV
jgi:hypothetical protein